MQMEGHTKIEHDLISIGKHTIFSIIISHNHLILRAPKRTWITLMLLASDFLLQDASSFCDNMTSLTDADIWGKLKASPKDTEGYRICSWFCV